jgi:hypothetical protein
VSRYDGSCWIAVRWKAPEEWDKATARASVVEPRGQRPRPLTSVGRDAFKSSRLIGGWKTLAGRTPLTRRHGQRAPLQHSLAGLRRGPARALEVSWLHILSLPTRGACHD